MKSKIKYRSQVLINSLLGTWPSPPFLFPLSLASLSLSLSLTVSFLPALFLSPLVVSICVSPLCLPHRLPGPWRCSHWFLCWAARDWGAASWLPFLWCFNTVRSTLCRLDLHGTLLNKRCLTFEQLLSKHFWGRVVGFWMFLSLE